MAASIPSYFSELSTAVSRGWNGFWFRGADPFAAAVVRIMVGAAGLAYVLSHTADLLRWFGPAPLVEPGAVRSLSQFRDLITIGESPYSFRLSLLNLVDQPAAVWAIHIATIVIMLALTCGLFSRVSSVLALVSVLMYVQRAPMIIGPLEPVLSMMLLYLCLAPSGEYLSLDRWWKARRGRSSPAAPSLAANISLNLMQLHLAGFYLLMGLSKLGGEVWWRGNGVWWLIARSDTALLDSSLLQGNWIVVNAWTHAIVAFELLFPLLVWNRLARPLLLALSVLMWLGTALLTGYVMFALFMIAANIVFIPPNTLRGLFSRNRSELEHASVESDSRRSKRKKPIAV